MNPEFPALDRAELELTRAFTRLCGYLPPPGVTDSAAVAVSERQSELASAIDRAMTVANDTLRAERDRLGAEIAALHTELRSFRDAPPPVYREFSAEIDQLPECSEVPAGMESSKEITSPSEDLLPSRGLELWRRVWVKDNNAPSPANIGVIQRDRDGVLRFIYRAEGVLRRDPVRWIVEGGHFRWYALRVPGPRPATIADVATAEPPVLREEYAGDVHNEPPEITNRADELAVLIWFPQGEAPKEPDYRVTGATGLWVRTEPSKDPMNRLFGYIQKLRGEWHLICRIGGKLYSAPVVADPRYRYAALR